ncbi:hypothetical protein P7C73_g3684, partial [Tremellales sp. Uapishka_1]
MSTSQDSPHPSEHESPHPTERSISADHTVSPGDTVVDLQAQGQGTTKTPAQGGVEISMSSKKKWFLLLVFSVAQYMDVASYSGLFVFTDSILVDLDIPYGGSSWIITAYSVTFASFLLFWGRVADLYSAKPVFCYGFLGLALCNIIISFMTNKYAYFVFRALSGIFSACTIPSAFRLILAIFEGGQLQTALTLFGMSGALANVTGLVLGGFIGYIHNGGQMLAWRWFFRIIAIVIIPFALSSFITVPNTKGQRADECTCAADKRKRLDVPGCAMMLISIILLILSLTLGAQDNAWKKAEFLVPFFLSWLFFVGFFFWEYRQSDGYALIPPSTWKIPNLTVLIVFALQIYPWWAVGQLAFVERFQVEFHESPIIAAVRMLPQGIAALAVAMTLPAIPWLMQNPRWPVTAGMVLGLVGYILMIFSHGNIGTDYWRYVFPGFVLGSGGMMAVFLATNITVMTSVPPEASGVAGALLQVSLQVGAVIGLSVQAGLLTLKPGNIENFYNVQASFWFQFGWDALYLVMFLMLFRQKKVNQAIEAKAEKGEAPAVI